MVELTEEDYLKVLRDNKEIVVAVRAAELEDGRVAYGEMDFDFEVPGLEITASIKMLHL